MYKHHSIKKKCIFFKKYPKLCNKWLLREIPSWWEIGLQEFIILARKECGYSKKTFWQDMWHPLKFAYQRYRGLL
jgi:hypothetical protein